MKIKLLIILSAILFLKNSFINSDIIENEYYVVFYTYKKNILESSLGHIFVGFERTVSGDIYREGKYGFIPKDTIDSEDFFNKVPVEGKLIDEKSTPIEACYKVKVSEEEYLAGLKVVSNWKNSTSQYIGMENDCISFSQSIANAIKLKVPPRGGNQLPESYLDEIRKANIDKIIGF